MASNYSTHLILVIIVFVVVGIGLGASATVEAKTNSAGPNGEIGTIAEDDESKSYTQYTGSNNSSVDEDAKRLNESDQPDSTVRARAVPASFSNSYVTRTVRITNRSAVNQSVFTSYNADILDEYKRLYQIQIPRNNIYNLEQVSWVKEITTSAKSHPGTISEGVSVVNADKVQAEGVNGAGTSVAILSCEGFDLGHEELPDDITAIKSFNSDGGIENNGENAHGTAVAATVADVAPSASYYFVNYDFSMLDYQRAIDWLIEQEVDVVAHSCGIFSQPDDGTGFYSNQTSRAVNNGIAWFNSAGNSADSHYQSSFTDSDGDGYHDITSDGIEVLTVQDDDAVLEAGDTFSAELQWDEWPTATNIDLIVYDINSGEPVKISDTVQDGDDDPVDTLTFTAPRDGTYALAIFSEEADADNFVEVTVTTDRYTLDRYVASGSVEAPAVADGVAGIAAFNWETGERTIYSSAGPADDGSRAITVSAPSHTDVNVYASGWWIFRDGSFTGTSAAAPHVAGVAALLKSINNGATPSDIYRAIKTGADDTGELGYDVYTGSGKLNATAAAEEIDPSVSLRLSVNRSLITVGDPVSFTVRRGDTYEPVNAVISVGTQTYQTGPDGEIVLTATSPGEYAVTATATDDPLTVDFEPASGDLRIWESDLTASVSFHNQTTDGRSVVVDQATLSEGGFLAIYQNGSGSAIGVSDFLTAGAHSDVEITLEENITGDATLIAVPHLDDNSNTLYDYPDADIPYIVNRTTVTDTAVVGLETTSGGVDSADRTVGATQVEPGGTVTVTDKIQMNENGGTLSVDGSFTSVSVANIKSITVDGEPTNPFLQSIDPTGYIVSFNNALSANATVEITYEITTPNQNNTQVIINGTATAGQTTVIDGGPTKVLTNDQAGPDFQVSNLDPAQASAPQGSTVTVSADIMNNGDVQGTQDVQLLVDGTVVATQTVTLAPGEAQNVQFQANTDNLAIGQYTHMISTDNDQGQGTLNVTVPVTQQAPQIDSGTEDSGTIEFSLNQQVTDDDTVPGEVNGAGTSLDANDFEVYIRRGGQPSTSLFTDGSLTVNRVNNGKFILIPQGVGDLDPVDTVKVNVTSDVVNAAGNSTTFDNFTVNTSSSVIVRNGPNNARSSAAQIYQGEPISFNAVNDNTRVFIRNVDTNEIILDGSTGTNSQYLTYDSDDLRSGATYKVIFGGTSGAGQYFEVTSLGLQASLEEDGAFFASDKNVTLSVDASAIRGNSPIIVNTSVTNGTDSIAQLRRQNTYRESLDSSAEFSAEYNEGTNQSGAVNSGNYTVTVTDVETGITATAGSFEVGGQPARETNGIESTSRKVGATEVRPGETVTVSDRIQMGPDGGTLSVSGSFDPSVRAATITSVTVDGTAVDPFLTSTDSSSYVVTFQNRLSANATVEIAYELTVPNQNGTVVTINATATGPQGQVAIGPTEISTNDRVGGGIDSVSRSITKKQVPPGGTTKATVTVNMNENGGTMSITEEFGPTVQNATITSVKVNGSEVTPFLASADPSGVVVTLENLASNAVVTATYEVDVANQVGAVHNITGNVTSGRTTNLGDDSILVVETMASRTLSSSEISPGGSITVTLEAQAQASALTFTEQFTPTVASATFQSASVNGTPVSNPTLGSADQDGMVATLSNLQAGDNVTVTYTVSVANNATAGDAIDISGTVTSGDQTDVPLSTDTLTVAEGSPLDPPVGQYDTDLNGEITIVELGGAASEYAKGEISITVLGEVASAYASS